MDEQKKLNVTISARPKISTQKLTLGQRSLGELVKLDIPQENAESEALRDLAGDIFHHLYKQEPEPIDRDEVHPGRRINARLLDWMTDAPNFEKSRQATAGSLPSARCAVPFMHEHLVSDEAFQSAMEAQQEAERLEKERQSEQAMADAMAQLSQDDNDEGEGEGEGGLPGGGSGESSPDYKQQAQEHQDKANELSEQVAKAVANADKKIDGLEEDKVMRAKLASALTKAEEEATETAAAMAGWGIDPSKKEYHDPNLAVKFAQMNNPRLKEIAKLAGRVKGISTQARRNRVTVGLIPTEVKLTKQIENLLPDELMKLHPSSPAVVRIPSVLEYLNNGLAGWHMTGDANEEGPFIFALDRSGSMGMGYESYSGKYHMQGIDIGLGIALGLAQLAEAVGRKFILYSFAHRGADIKSVTSEEGWEARMRWASQGPSGGTSFDTALEWAMKKLIEVDGPVNGTDLIFCTDGWASISDENYEAWEEFNRTTGSRMMYVPVDVRGQNTNPQLEELADSTMVLDQLANDDVDQLAGKVGNWMK